ncbi:MAG: hypothetical protein NTZ19_01465 [Bacteroidetes bacterium]|nr:hypothetical protein [Bacteroidota bacterium]
MKDNPKIVLQIIQQLQADTAERVGIWVGNNSMIYAVIIGYYPS